MNHVISMLKLVRNVVANPGEIKSFVEFLEKNSEKQIKTFATEEAKKYPPRILEMTRAALEKIVNNLFTVEQKRKYGKKCQIIGKAIKPGALEHTMQMQQQLYLE